MRIKTCFTFDWRICFSFERPWVSLFLLIIMNFLRSVLKFLLESRIWYYKKIIIRTKTAHLNFLCKFEKFVWFSVDFRRVSFFAVKRVSKNRIVYFAQSPEHTHTRRKWISGHTNDNQVYIQYSHASNSIYVTLLYDFRGILFGVFWICFFLSCAS